jgi:uncharacterized lipoprotein YajG
MPTQEKLMTRHSLIRKAAMVGVLAPVAMLAACAQDPAPAAPVQAAPPPPVPAPAPVPRVRG